MINLVSTSDKVQVITGSAASVDCEASYVDNNSGAITPGAQDTATISSATTTDIVSAPGSSVQRNVKFISVRNRHASASSQVTVKKVGGTNSPELISVQLLPGESLFYNDVGGWQCYASNGAIKTTAITNPFTNGFRLTGVTGTPVMTADSTSLSTIFCTPWDGQQIALYDGARWQLLSSAEFSLAVTGRTTDLPFDIFCFNSAGTPTLEFLDWSSATARATGLTRQDGVWTKTGDATRRYMGSCRPRSATTYHWVTVGTDLPCKFDLFNNDNRVAVRFQLKASTATWNYTTATIRQAQASTNYQVDLMVGLQEEYFEGLLQVNSTNSTISIGRSVGIGFDVTNAFTAGQSISAINTVASIMSTQEARLSHQPTIGRHFYAWNETSVATGTATWTGASATAGFNLQSGMTGGWRC